jgi:hypothetical protein
MKTTSFVFALLSPLAVAQNCFDTAPVGSFLGSTSDVIYPPRPIGFAFPLGGTTYADIGVSDHGLVFLSNGGVPPPPLAVPFVWTPSLANFGSGRPILAALWTDMIPDPAAGPTAGVYVDSNATRCRIEWRDMVNAGFTSRFNLALTLFANGNLRFDYDPAVTNDSFFGGVSAHGIVGVAAGGLLGAPVDLTAGGTSVGTTVFENWTVPDTFDLADRSLLLVPNGAGWTYSLLQTGCASATDYGAGCGAGLRDSVYEPFTPSLFDLTGTTIRWVRTADGYLVQNGVGTFVVPGPTAAPVASGLVDGQQQFALSLPMPIPGGTTTLLNITTKGQVELRGTPQAVDFTPTVNELLAWPNTAFHCWHDFDRTRNLASRIVFEEVGGFAYATWSMVPSFGTVSPNTVQWQFDLGTGDVTLVVVTAVGMVNPAIANYTVVGFSTGGVSSDPGVTNLGTIGAPVLVEDAVAPLGLTTNGLPRLGSNQFGFQLSAVPPLVPVAFLFFGDTVLDPGSPLDAFGMTGCAAWTNGNLGSVTLPVIADTARFTLPIPNNPGLVGLTFSTMGVAFSLRTPRNLIASNGTRVAIGF